MSQRDGYEPEDQHNAAFSVKLASRDAHVRVDDEPATLSVDGDADRAVINAVSTADRYTAIEVNPDITRELAGVLLTYADNAESGALKPSTSYHWEVPADE